MTNEDHNLKRVVDDEESSGRDPDFGFPVIQPDEATNHHVITLPSAIRELYAKRLVCVPHTSESGDNELGLYKLPRWRATKAKLKAYQISPDLTNYFLHRSEIVKINEDTQIKVSDELVEFIDADHDKVSFKHHAGVVSLYEKGKCCDQDYCTKCTGKNCRELYCPIHTARKKLKDRNRLWGDTQPKWKFVREKQLLKDFAKAKPFSKDKLPSYKHRSR